MRAMLILARRIHGLGLLLPSVNLRVFDQCRLFDFKYALVIDFSFCQHSRDRPRCMLLLLQSSVSSGRWTEVERGVRRCHYPECWRAGPRNSIQFSDLHAYGWRRGSRRRNDHAKLYPGREEPHPRDGELCTAERF